MRIAWTDILAAAAGLAAGAANVVRLYRRFEPSPRHVRTIFGISLAGLGSFAALAWLFRETAPSELLVLGTCLCASTCVALGVYVWRR